MMQTVSNNDLLNSIEQFKKQTEDVQKLVDNLATDNNQKPDHSTHTLSSADTAKMVREIQARHQKESQQLVQADHKAEESLVDKLLNAESTEEAKKIQQAMQDMVTSASVISDSLTFPSLSQVSTSHKLTKAEIEQQEEFLKKEKARIAMEEQMMAQQEKLRQEIEAKQKMLVKQVVEKVKKEHEESQKKKLEEWLEQQRKETEAEEERQRIAKLK